MNILDENVLEDQRRLLLDWQVPFRQIGYEVGRKGMKDDEIIPLLLTIRRPTFFTLDVRFCRRELCHSRYCLVCMDIHPRDAAASIRRLLRHPELDTQAKRMGSVIRMSRDGLAVWHLHAEREVKLDWAHDRPPGRLAH